LCITSYIEENQCYTFNIMKNIHIPSFSNKKHLALILTAASFSFIVALFVVTKKDSSVSELAFTERSTMSGIRGSVIPASCNSNPPTNHFAGDCPNPTVSLSGLPHTQAYGASYGGMSWNSSNATHCEVHRDGTFISLLPTSGSLDSVPRFASANYTFSCFNAVGVMSQANGGLTVQGATGISFSGSAPVLPTPPPTLGTLNLDASPQYVEAGDSPTLTWSAIGATSCTAGGSWSGSKSTGGGSENVNQYHYGTQNISRTYTLFCTNGVYSTNSSVTVYFQGEYADQNDLR
jgi:hypothetical protein